ncbi:branched-chain-amino-acid aminotransferase-like protein 1 [Gigaspora margarita]|uniref:Branched-chain-amino-acid aminotransferase-like protein 1 n=1 Tax=Gigaspora margarita TaxID=4874 RepID=A0A8H3XEE8_GIGMA|nr:branched-chain-amino-acid aminotransferase-like protein 1 [Gigaspora margarita]
MSERKPIFLLSHPRCISHAFSRPFLQRSQDFHVFSEPFLDFFLHTDAQHSKDVKNGVADPSKHSNLSLFTPKVLSIFDDVWKTYYDETSKRPRRVFWHEHSLFLLKAIPGISFLSNPQFLEMTHTFLIRNPEKSIRSLYKATNFVIPKIDEHCVNPGFDKNLVGLKQSKQIFDFLKDLNKQPIVVDADDVINDPEGTLKKYCELIGEEFKEEMIKWEAKPINEFRFKGDCTTISELMNHNAENSTGFNKFTNKYEYPEIEYPQIVYDAITDSKPYYDYLYQFRI